MHGKKNDVCRAWTTRDKHSVRRRLDVAQDRYVPTERPGDQLS